VRIEFSIPPPHELLKSVCSVPIARRSESWFEGCLGPEGKKQGVYVIHHGDRIIYVGKTDGPSMSFGVRLRREFQESASGGRHIFPKLAALQNPPGISVYLLATSSIRKMVTIEGTTLTDTELIPICEAVLIAAYRPELQV
jgi:hypothetical protein